MSHGILLLDKPAGLSSNAALQRVRRLFGWPKAGHTGTLDPLATGLLPICLGEATKFSHALLSADKAYDAAIKLGFRSSTADAEGALEAGTEPAFSQERLLDVLRSFVGEIQQVPPMHSALKKDGRPLYDYARAGKFIERKPRNIIINLIQLIEYKYNIIRISVVCSKGTYIRVLAADIGEALGCGGYLLALRRTAVGDLSLAAAVTLDELAAQEPGERAARLLPMDSLVRGYPAVHLDAQASRRIINGLAVQAVEKAGLIRLYDLQGGFMGIGECLDDGTLVPRRLVSTVSTAGKQVAGE